MAWSIREHIEKIIAQSKVLIKDVRIVRYDIGQSRAIIDLEGFWKDYRIIISEIHRFDKGVRYAYYILDNQGHIVHAFDNSPDNLAIKQKYGL